MCSICNSEQPHSSRHDRKDYGHDMDLDLNEPLYMWCQFLQQRQASRPDATQIRFLLDYQERQRGATGANRTVFTHLQHFTLGDVHDWCIWDIPLRTMIEDLCK